MVIAEIATGLSGLKTALDILKGLKNTSQAKPFLGEIAELQSALIDAQHGLMTANQTHSADIDRVRALEAEVDRLKKWNGDKENYQLENIADGSAVAYMLKPAARGTQPPHWICPTCFHNGEIGLIQAQGRNPKMANETSWACGKCGNGFTINFNYMPRWT